MPAYQLLRSSPQEKQYELTKEQREVLHAELDKCVEVKETYRNKAETFLTEYGICHIADIEYETRKMYEKFLQEEIAQVSRSAYLKGFDRIKQHAIREEMQTLSGRRKLPLQYDNRMLYLPYHPDQELAAGFYNAVKKEELAWDFGKAAPDKMKRQIFDILHYVIREYQNFKTRRRNLAALRIFYDYCTEQKIKDIECMEWEQTEKFRKAADGKGERTFYIVDVCRKALFMEADETHWHANVWYLERFHFESSRVNPAKPVISLSFLEVKSQRNSSILKEYMKYGLGITSLSIGNLRYEFLFIRNFLIEIERNGIADICRADADDMRKYFHSLDTGNIQAETYNKHIMSILHFFDFMRVRGYIERIPFHAQYYLKKTVLKHHDRSVDQKVYMEVLQKLGKFPEDIRLMFLHLWGTGLRASEVCTLKGNAYYTQNGDTWMQVYQIKMKSYKRIPVPAALYLLMKVYIDKHEIKAEDYIFQNRKGGAYCYATFRCRILKCCQENGIADGEYLFKSHDFRHTLATLFHNEGVSVQGIRDYLGHEYEEMTMQYIDFIPKKIAGANEEYFSNPENSLAAGLERK